jgi:hypothetical protein
MPENTVSVTRPGKWGNPFKVSDYFDAGYSGSADVAAHHCVEAYRAWMLGKSHWAHGIPMPEPPNPSELRGKNLACWCAIGQPCHADVLLEIANKDGE